MCNSGTRRLNLNCWPRYYIVVICDTEYLVCDSYMIFFYCALMHFSGILLKMRLKVRYYILLTEPISKFKIIF